MFMTRTSEVGSAAVLWSVGMSSFVKRKWPIWFVLSWRSWPDADLAGGDAMMPAFSTRMSRRELCLLKDWAASLTDSRDAVSRGSHSMSMLSDSSAVTDLIASRALDSFLAARKILAGLCLASWSTVSFPRPELPSSTSAQKSRRFSVEGPYLQLQEWPFQQGSVCQSTGWILMTTFEESIRRLLSRGWRYMEWKGPSGRRCHECC